MTTGNVIDMMTGKEIELKKRELPVELKRRPILGEAVRAAAGGGGVVRFFALYGRQFRTLIDRFGERWFAGVDAARCLTYENESQAVRLHCKHAKLLKYIDPLIPKDGTLPPNLLMIPESDIYRLIISSHKPEAEKFEQWVF